MYIVLCYTVRFVPDTKRKIPDSAHRFGIGDLLSDYMKGWVSDRYLTPEKHLSTCAVSTSGFARRVTAMITMMEMGSAIRMLST